MIRKSTNEDISDEELEKIINPFYDNYHEFIVSYIMPEVIAYYLASSYSRNAMWESSFLQHYNSAKDIIRLTILDSMSKNPSTSKKFFLSTLIFVIFLLFIFIPLSIITSLLTMLILIKKPPKTEAHSTHQYKISHTNAH